MGSIKFVQVFMPGNQPENKNKNLYLKNKFCAYNIRQTKLTWAMHASR